MKYLIVVDMQNDFVSGCLGSDAARAIVKRVEKEVKSFDGKVIFTMDTHSENYLDTQEGKKLPVIHCVENTDGWKIIPELQPYVTDFVTKPTFGSVELAKHLCEENSKEKIESIELIGVCTSICVISNAMLIKAFLPEVRVIVNADCCACVSEESHNAALKAMETAQIEIVRD
jgi:nicotinamidase-related amidase